MAADHHPGDAAGRDQSGAVRPARAGMGAGFQRHIEVVDPLVKRHSPAGSKFWLHPARALLEPAFVACDSFWIISELDGFSNLTPDHLDYHQTMDRYFDAKARLFAELGSTMKLPRSGKGRLSLEVIELADQERPPMIRIPEYLERRRATTGARILEPALR